MLQWCLGYTPIGSTTVTDAVMVYSTFLSERSSPGEGGGSAEEKPIDGGGTELPLDRMEPTG